MKQLIYALAFASLVTCQQNPSISYISKERIINVGDSVDLQCSVQYVAQYPVLWVKVEERNQLFISTGSTLVLPEPRFSIRHDEASNTFTLQITKVQETDGGHYQCQVIIGPTSKLTSDVFVHVRVAPIISDNSTRSVITSVGANVSLECYAAGYPPPRISWRRENNNLLPTGGALYRGNVLNIFNVTKDHRGTYYCIADNGVGSGARRNVGVEIEFAPYVTVERPRYGQALQYPADLLCHVEAFPSPSIIWLKDGYQLSDNIHYKISIFATSDEFTDTTLRLNAIEKRQYGNYTCRAINKLGSDERFVELYETVNVICPPACGSAYLLSDATCQHKKGIHYSLIVILASLFYCIYRQK